MEKSLPIKDDSCSTSRGSPWYRGWLRRFWDPESAERAKKGGSDSEVVQLRALVAQLRQINQRQQNTIHYLKEINHRLEAKCRAVDEFVHQGALRQHQQQQDKNLEAISRLHQDIVPILNGIEGFQGVSPERLAELRQHSRQIETQIAQLRTEMTQQRQELLAQLKEKDLSLRLQEADMESICTTNRQLQLEIRKLRLENIRQREQLAELEQLRKALRNAENQLQIFYKKYQAVLAERDLLKPLQGLAQENSVLKKTVLHLEGKLRQATHKMAQIKSEYEKLLEEYEQLFRQY